MVFHPVERRDSGILLRRHRIPGCRRPEYRDLSTSLRSGREDKPYICRYSLGEGTRGREVVRPEGVEPPTYWFVASCSIQLSYGRTRSLESDNLKIAEISTACKRRERMVRPEGFEPPTLWFEARCSIQLSYGRIPLRLGRAYRWDGVHARQIPWNSHRSAPRSGAHLRSGLKPMESRTSKVRLSSPETTLLRAVSHRAHAIVRLDDVLLLALEDRTDVAGEVGLL